MKMNNSINMFGEIVLFYHHADDVSTLRDISACGPSNTKSKLGFYMLLHSQVHTGRQRGQGGAVVTHLPPTSEIGGSNPEPYVKVGGCLSMVDSVQCRTLTTCMCRFPLSVKLPILICPIQC